MSYKSVQRTRWLAEKTTLEARLTTLNTTLDNMASSEVKKYAYDSAEGRQAVTRRDFDEIQKQIDNTDARLTWVCQKLAGLGVVVTRLRRKKHHDHHIHHGGHHS